MLRSLVEEFREFVAEFSANSLNDSAAYERAREVAADLRERLAALQVAYEERKRVFAPALEEAARNLRAFSADLGEHPRAVRLREQGEKLAESYEARVAQLRVQGGKLAENYEASVAKYREHREKLAYNYEELRHYLKRVLAPSAMRSLKLTKLKPVNYTRNVFHVGMGVGAVLVYEFLLSPAQCMGVIAALCVAAVSTEILRRFFPKFNDLLMDTVFRRIARPRERLETNSATYYSIALLLVLALMPGRAVELGLLVLAFGDPAASVLGKRFGKRKLWREKSLVGFNAFVGLSFLVSFGFLSLTMGAETLVWRLGVAAIAAVVGAVTELFSERLDDNFTILVMTAGVLTLAVF